MQSTTNIANDRLQEAPRITALRMVTVARTPRFIGKLLFWMFIALPPALLFIPWQQSVTGIGRVVARDPMKRPQIIQAPIYGRIEQSWVQENMEVKKGDKLLRIVDNDPNLMTRLNDELEAKQSKLNATKDKVKINESVIHVLEGALEQTNAAYAALVKAGRNKVDAKQAEFSAASAGVIQAAANIERFRKLRGDGLISQLDLEREERKYQEDINKEKKAEQEVKEAENELVSKERELEKQLSESQAKIKKALGDVQEAAGDVALAEAEIASHRVKIARVAAQEIIAPADGRIVRILANLGAEVLKEGTPLLEFVPVTDDYAVELLMDGNDVPLIVDSHHNDEGKLVLGDPVRLQFEGWPAVQFVGWPSAAIGTFGGRVILIDETPYIDGKFRIVVVPDPEEQQDPNRRWPEHRFLRQGNKANGWVLLRTVSLGQELWRRLNGFPPVIEMGTPTGKKKGDIKGDFLDEIKEKEKEPEYKIKLK
jgi:membrane fusion protein, adhesin transport system